MLYLKKIVLNVCQHEFNFHQISKRRLSHKVKDNFSSFSSCNKKKKKKENTLSVYFATGYNHLHFPIGANEKV